MAKKLKDVELNSVDLCKRGANQYADIKLRKNFEEGGTEVAKKGFKGLMNSLFRKSQGVDAPAEFLEECEKVEKSVMTPDEVVADANERLAKSIDTIMSDEGLDESGRLDKLHKSVEEYGSYIEGVSKDWVNKACRSKNVAKEDDMDDDMDDDEDDDMDDDDDMDVMNGRDPDDQGADPKSPVADNTKKGKGEEDMDIEKMNMEELEKAEAMIKARKEQLCKSAPEKTEDDEVKKAVAEAQKELEEVKKSYQAQIDELKKNAEMAELKAIAKSYEMVDGDTDKLADKLYMMKKAGEDVYKAYIENLDGRKDLVEKSGLFKSFGSDKSGSEDPHEKAIAFAKSIREKNPGMTMEKAIDQAYMEHPELIPQN